MVRRAVLGMALFGMMGTAALGQTMLGARATDGTQAGGFQAGQTYNIEYYITNLTPLNPATPAALNWQLDFDGFDSGDAALSYGTFTQDIQTFPPPTRVVREFWDFTRGPLWTFGTGEFILFVEDPLDTPGPDNRGSSQRRDAAGDPEPIPGPGWSVNTGPTAQVFMVDFTHDHFPLLDEVVLAIFEVKIDDGADASNTVLGGGGPLAQLEWVTAWIGGLPDENDIEPGFGQTVGGLIGKSLVPEPATMALLVAGLGGGLVARRRRS